MQLSLPSKTQWKHGLATGWLENATKLFVKESSALTLLEVCKYACVVVLQ